MCTRSPSLVWRRGVPRRPSAEAAQRADAALLTRRLMELGLSGMRGVEVHENRTVLVSVTSRGVLRVHRGYAYATDPMRRTEA